MSHFSQRTLDSSTPSGRADYLQMSSIPEFFTHICLVTSAVVSRFCSIPAAQVYSASGMFLHWRQNAQFPLFEVCGRACCNYKVVILCSAYVGGYRVGFRGWPFSASAMLEIKLSNLVKSSDWKKPIESAL